MAVSSQELSAIPYFAGLTAKELESIAPFVFDKAFSRNQLIILENEPCRSVYFVAAGSVKVSKTSPSGRELVLRIIRKGESFNEVPVFDGGPNPATVTALEPTVVYEVPKEKLELIIRHYPQVALNVLATFAQRLRQMVTLAEDLSFRHVMGRVAKLLLEQSVVGEGSARLTQQEMAALTGTAREVVSRSLKALESMGAIKVEGRQIQIVNADLLKQLV